MSTRIITAFVLAFAAALVAAPIPAHATNPGVMHTVFMAGSVIESSADGVYLCIGTAEGAKVGQQLDVVRLTRDKSVNPKQGTRFNREKVGTVKIDAIVDEHYAQATVISGTVEKGDIVALAGAAEDAKQK